MTSLTASPARARTLIGAAVVGAVLLVMGMIEWGSVWYFPIDGRSLFTITRPLGAQYRVLLWGMVIVGLLVALLRGRPGPGLRALTPFAPFVLIAAVAIALGDQPSVSAWYVAQWLVMAVAAAVVGLLTPSSRIARTALWTFLAVLAGSLALYLLVPRIGSMQVNGRGGLLRGLFPGKQFAGWFATLAVVWAVSMRTHRWDLKRLALIALALVVLVRAQSAGAVAALAAGLAYWGLVRGLRMAPITPVGRAVVALLVALVAGAAVLFGLPALLQLFGRDPTLTGRTELWGLYLRFMQDNELIGRGPGAFAMGSPINLSIAPHADDFVVSTHNMYLTMFGDTGFLGVGLYVAAFAWIAFVAPFLRTGPESATSAVLALMVLSSGFAEARDTLTPGLASFLIITLRTSSLSARAGPVRSSSRGQARDAERPVRRRRTIAASA